MLYRSQSFREKVCIVELRGDNKTTFFVDKTPFAVLFDSCQSFRKEVCIIELRGDSKTAFFVDKTPFAVLFDSLQTFWEVVSDTTFIIELRDNNNFSGFIMISNLASGVYKRCQILSGKREG